MFFWLLFTVVECYKYWSPKNVTHPLGWNEELVSIETNLAQSFCYVNVEYQICVLNANEEYKLLFCLQGHHFPVLQLLFYTHSILLSCSKEGLFIWDIARGGACTHLYLMIVWYLMQNFRFDHMHVLHLSQFSLGLWHNKWIDHYIGSNKPILRNWSAQLAILRDHLYARYSGASNHFLLFPVPKSACGSKSRYAYLSLGCSLLRYIQFPRFANLTRYIKGKSRRCDGSHLLFHRGIFIFRRTWPFYSALEHSHRQIHSICGWLAESSVGQFLEFQK